MLTLTYLFYNPNNSICLLFCPKFMFQWKICVLPMAQQSELHKMLHSELSLPPHPYHLVPIPYHLLEVTNLLTSSLQREYCLSWICSTGGSINSYRQRVHTFRRVRLMMPVVTCLDLRYMMFSRQPGDEPLADQCGSHAKVQEITLCLLQSNSNYAVRIPADTTLTKLSRSTSPPRRHIDITNPLLWCTEKNNIICSGGTTSL